MDQTFQVLQVKHEGNIWVMSVNVMNRLKLKENDTVTLKCGAAETTARICPAPDLHESVMGLSPSCLSSLSIPKNISLTVKPLDNKTFRLGPVIGILTFPGHVINRLDYYGVYARRYRNRGLLYVFRGRDIDAKRRVITGCYLDPVEKIWKRREFPFPDAVIDRLYPNSYRCHALLEGVIGRGKIFNKKSMIDKVHFAKALVNDKFLKNYIPQTKVFENIRDADRYLKRYKTVFLKPFNGMKGLGIVTVSRTSQGNLNCVYRANKELVTREIKSASQIPDILIHAAGRVRPYIIQQGIERMEFKGGPFSIRTWAMKNGKGRWIMPGMFAKGTMGAGFLTNFTAGAKLIPLKELFNEIIPKMSCSEEKLKHQLEDLTLRTAEVLDRHYGPLGELGLDIVFDLKGKPWLIEANGNPGNIPIFMQKEYPAWRNLVFQLPLDYATYLAGFAS